MRVTKQWFPQGGKKKPEGYSSEGCFTLPLLFKCDNVLL